MEVLVMLFNTVCRAIRTETTTATILDAQYWIEIRWMFYCIIELGSTFCVNSSRVQVNHNCWSIIFLLGRESWTEIENKRKHNTNWLASIQFDSVCARVHKKVIHAFCCALSKDPACNFPSKAYIDEIRQRRWQRKWDGERKKDRTREKGGEQIII